MGLLIVKQRQVEGLGSNATLMDQLSNLSRAYVNEIVIPSTGANQIFTVGTSYETNGNVLKVFYNGQLQRPGQTYNEIDNQHIQFPDMVYQGDLIVLRIEGAGSGTAFVSDHGHSIREIMAGIQDGTNTQFTTALLPANDKEEVYVNGQLQTPTSQFASGDYAIDYNSPPGKATVTFVKPPLPSDIVLTNYIYSIKN